MRSVLCYGDSNTHGQIPGGSPLNDTGQTSAGPVF